MCAAESVVPPTAATLRLDSVVKAEDDEDDATLDDEDDAFDDNEMDGETDDGKDDGKVDDDDDEALTAACASTRLAQESDPQNDGHTLWQEDVAVSHPHRKYCSTGGRKKALT